MGADIKIQVRSLDYGMPGKTPQERLDLQQATLFITNTCQEVLKKHYPNITVADSASGEPVYVPRPFIQDIASKIGHVSITAPSSQYNILFGQLAEDFTETIVFAPILMDSSTMDDDDD